MKVPFSLTKGSSLDLYAIVPGMSVIFSSTYNLNVTVSTKYSNLVYQTREFNNETNSTHRNLKSVKFGSFTGRIRVVALEDTSFVYETIRGEFDRNETCDIKEDDFTAEQENKILPPSEHQDHVNHHGDGKPHDQFPPFHQFPDHGNHDQQPGDHDRQHPGDHDHNRQFPPRHQQPGDHNNHHQFPPHHQQPDDHMKPQKPEKGNGRDSYGYERNYKANTDSFSFDGIFDSIFILIVCIGFIGLGIALVVSIVRACKNNNCCSHNNSINDVDDSSIPPIIQQVDNFEQYIPPCRYHQQKKQIPQQTIHQIPLNYPQLQPFQQVQPMIIPPPQPQVSQPIQPNYYQQPVFIQQPIQQNGVIQQKPQ